ncbi:hypothetical protein SD77_0327 [Bacillus badius]|uniref:Uncharacterized protein n=1 Tax=Bacillus badius TaxID=1455 RepID=A0ABR5B0H9_BACBA|nr:hypothetical protein SD78_3658 [Bacillus badius]KIL80479.1 hypothetical protein SD77_0327 [Bacillus badius]
MFMEEEISPLAIGPFNSLVEKKPFGAESIERKKPLARRELFLFGELKNSGDKWEVVVQLGLEVEGIGYVHG